MQDVVYESDLSDVEWSFLQSLVLVPTRPQDLLKHPLTFRIVTTLCPRFYRANLHAVYGRATSFTLA